MLRDIVVMALITILLILGEPFLSGRVNCDFETDNCKYTNSRNDDFDWKHYSGSTPSAFTGPFGDHTTGNGEFLGKGMNLPMMFVRQALFVTGNGRFVLFGQVHGR